METKNPLGYEKISKLLTKFAIPSIIAMLVSACYNIVDQIFIGQGVGLLGNAATNVAFPLNTICTATALLLGIGGATKFSLSLGQKKPEQAAQAAGNAITMMVMAGLSIFVLVSLLLEPILLLCGATPDVLPYAMTYTRITAFGFPLAIATTAMSALIRADGSPQYSMFAMVIGAVVNMILDPLFIFVFDLGVAGAAYATVIGQVFSSILVIRYIFHFKHIQLSKDSFHLKFEVCRRIWSLGASNCFNQLAMTLTQIVMNNTLRYYGALSIYGSDIPLACAGIVMKVNMIFMALVIGISQGTQPIIGFNYGAKQYQRVKDTYFLALKVGFFVSFAGFCCFQLFPRQIISIFGNGSEEYFTFATRYFRIFLFMSFGNFVQPITANFFTSIGKAIKGIFLSLTRQVIFLLPLFVIFPIFLGIDGVMYAGPFADGAALILAYILVKKEMKILHQKELASSESVD